VDAPLRLGPDLVFTALGGDRWIVSDPNRGVAFKVSTSAILMLRALRGQGMEEAFLAYQKETSTKLNLEAFALEANKLLSSISAKCIPPRRRLTASFILVRHVTLSRLAGHFTWLIRPIVLAANAAALAILCAILLPHAGWVSSSTSGISAALLPTILILSMLAHEVGHGAALRAHGHDAGSLGIGIYLIYPVFFIEMFTHEALAEREKFWVNVAGVHFQAMFGHCIAIAALLGHSLMLSRAAWLIYLSAAFQLIPINRSDGYWLMTDLVRATRNPWLTNRIGSLVNLISGLFFAGSILYSIRHVFLPLRKVLATAQDSNDLLRVIATPLAWVALAQLVIFALLIVRLPRNALRRRKARCDALKIATS